MKRFGKNDNDWSQETPAKPYDPENDAGRYNIVNRISQGCY